MMTEELTNNGVTICKNSRVDQIVTEGGKVRGVQVGDRAVVGGERDAAGASAVDDADVEGGYYLWDRATLEGVLDDVVDLFAPAAAERGVNLAYDQRTAVSVTGDPGRLRRGGVRRQRLHLGPGQAREAA